MMMNLLQSCTNFAQLAITGQYISRKSESLWRSNGEWKARYSKLYSSRRISLNCEVVLRLPTGYVEITDILVGPKNPILESGLLWHRTRLLGQHTGILIDQGWPAGVSILTTLVHGEFFYITRSVSKYQIYNFSDTFHLSPRTSVLMAELPKMRYKLIRPQENSTRVSFMSNDTPYNSLLMRMRSNSLKSSYGNISSFRYKSPMYSNLKFQTYFMGSADVRSDNLGGNETRLLDMVRARSKEFQEGLQDQVLELPREIADDQSSEACVHGLSMRMTERSISRSRSRVSRMSTRRDMDIPSILAFTTSTPAPVYLEIPAFQKTDTKEKEDTPRFSIRRSVCPVCSQKWKDRSSINKIRYSGLKRNSSTELPSIIAPARLRTSITSAYMPRPTLAMIDEEAGSMRNTSATWQLTRARRFRLPKKQTPPPEAIAPPSATAPLARKDLDLRVTRFITD